MLSSSIAAPSISFAHEQGKRPTQDDSTLIAHVTKMGAIEYARAFKQFIESCKTGEFLSHERSGTTFCLNSIGAICDKTQCFASDDLGIFYSDKTHLSKYGALMFARKMPIN